MNPTLRLALFLAACGAVSACAELDCAQPMRYHGAKTEPRLTVPEGLTPLETRDTHAIPGGPPPADYAAGACLVKPPRLVEDPTPKDD